MRTVMVLASLLSTVALEQAARADQPAPPPAPAPGVQALRQPLTLHVDLELTLGVTEATADGEQGAVGLRLGFPLGRFLVLEGQMSSDVAGLFSQDTGSSAWGGLRVHLPTKLAPYVFARAGYHNHDHYPACGLFSACDPSAPPVSHDASLRDFGLGFEARLGHFRFFAESGYGNEGLTSTLGVGAGF